MSFEKSQYVDPKENGSPIIFDFKDDNAKVSLNFYKNHLITIQYYLPINYFLEILF